MRLQFCQHVIKMRVTFAKINLTYVSFKSASKNDLNKRFKALTRNEHVNTTNVRQIKATK